MIPFDKEPTHAYEYWLRLQTERVIDVAKADLLGASPLPMDSEPQQMLFIGQIKGLIKHKNYSRARSFCLIAASFLIRQAAWLHRLEVRQGQGATGPRPVNEGPFSSSFIPHSPSSKGAEQP